MARPIFVLGRNRSGTKWLTNLIANHPDVYCVQSESHGGVIETNLFDRADTSFGNPAIAENYIAFMAWFEQTDFFYYSNLEPDDLIHCRADSFHEVFRNLMDTAAERAGKSVWV